MAANKPEGETQQNILAQKMGRKDRPLVPHRPDQDLSFLLQRSESKHFGGTDVSVRHYRLIRAHERLPDAKITKQLEERQCCKTSYEREG